ncbi:MAG: serine/threonine protein kinase [Myxococcales bacterium]|nr:serine/threonine protein kinase [Myxococcales bacterium]
MTRASDSSSSASSGEGEPSEPSLAQSGESVTDTTSLGSDGSLDGETGEDFLRALARVPSTPPPTVELLPGQIVGGYRIDGKLGEGGMGVVYAAIDPKLNRSVALKVLPDNIGSDRRARFLREARSASAVDHPSIAMVFAVGEDAGSIFIAMERVYGVTLRAHLISHAGPLSESDALRIIREIASALSKAHAVGVVHRDLKPENLMLTEDGRIKILDFGLAKLRGAEDSTGEREVSEFATREGRILGTPSYMSPEQAKGGRVDARSDLFSLGVVLYELLSGKRPFIGSTTMALLIAIDRDDYEPLAKACPGADAPLEALLARCLAKLPEDRFATADALVAAIDGLPWARHQARQRRWAAAGLALALVILAGVLASRLGSEPSTARPTRLVESAGVPAVAPAPTGPPTTAAVEPSAAATFPASVAGAPSVSATKRRPVVPRADPLSDQK